MIEIEKHHLANTTVNFTSKNHQWMFNFLCKCMIETGYLYNLSVSLHKMLINCKGENCNFKVEQSGRYHLSVQS